VHVPAYEPEHEEGEYAEEDRPLDYFTFLVSFVSMTSLKYVDNTKEVWESGKYECIGRKWVY
jgi:hypothetical protein